ncbi:MAG: von Willebrand factor type A domain-containing protein, partial [Psychromonas sp.]
MKYSIQKSAQVGILSSLLLVAACGPTPQVDNSGRVDNDEIKEQLLKDKKIESEIAGVTEVDAIKSATREEPSLSLTKPESDYMARETAKVLIQAPSFRQHIADNISVSSMTFSDRENYSHNTDNPVHLVTEQPVSTFSIDVDTASYSN